MDLVTLDDSHTMTYHCSAKLEVILPWEEMVQIVGDGFKGEIRQILLWQYPENNVKKQELYTSLQGCSLQGASFHAHWHLVLSMNILTT